MTRLTTVAIAMLLAATSAASADTICGTNPDLPSGSDLYIPLKSSSSGVLGNGNVGKVSDSVTLWDNDSASGYVDVRLTYDLSGILGDDLELDTAGPMTLGFTFEDIDFKPSVDVHNSLRVTFTESIQFAYLRDANDSPGAFALTMDDASYLTYKTNPGTETNNTTATYEIDLRSALGVDAADIDDINTDKEFGLYVRLRSDLVSEDLWPLWCNGSTRVNTPESIGGCFEVSVQPVPEPATIAVLSLGGVLIAVRRRRR